jgi:hypothetical protein
MVTLSVVDTVAATAEKFLLWPSSKVATSNNVRGKEGHGDDNEQEEE